MKIAVITPTRGDRPNLLQQCKKYVAEQTLQPFKHYIIDYTPKSEACDLIPRIKEGLKQAKADGCDYIFIFEDDDFYHPEYIELYINKGLYDFDFIGVNSTFYYHLKTQQFVSIFHGNRASLFNTAFSIKAIDKFKWPNDDFANLDFELWKYAATKISNAFFLDPILNIGIKHGIGKTGGSAHNENFEYQQKDKNFELLAYHTGKHFNFYKNLQTQLNNA